MHARQCLSHSELDPDRREVLTVVITPRCLTAAHLELGGEGSDAVPEARQLSSLHLGGPRAGLQLVHLPLHGCGSLPLLLQLLHRQCRCVPDLKPSA